MTLKLMNPMHGQVLCRVLNTVNERPGSKLILPDTAMGRPNQALVVEVGRGWFQNGVLIEPQVKPGMKVIFDPYKITLVLADGQLAKAQGTPIAKAGEEFLIHEAHILVEIDEASDA